MVFVIYVASIDMLVDIWQSIVMHRDRLVIHKNKKKKKPEKKNSTKKKFNKQKIQQTKTNRKAKTQMQTNTKADNQNTKSNLTRVKKQTFRWTSILFRTINETSTVLTLDKKNSNFHIFRSHY
jgi:hypothetical protein